MGLECRTDRLDGRSIAAFAEVGDRLEWEHEFVV
jgi:hypothetical protein